LFKLLTHTIQNIPPIRLCVLVPRTANNNNFFFSSPMAIFYYFVCDSVHTHEPTREREKRNYQIYYIESRITARGPAIKVFWNSSEIKLDFLIYIRTCTVHTTQT
jgi:hypothetical protein